MPMRGFLTMLLAAASLPLLAWEAPAPAEWAAILGEEPFVSAQAAGLPLPPTREEARQESAWRYGQQRLALKRVLVYRISRAKADRHRITPENNKATASLARQLKAPDLFAAYLDLLAGETLSRRQEYALNQALQYMLQETYGIDTLSIRLMSETLALPAPEHLACMQQMPLYVLFDSTEEQPAFPGTPLADMQTMTTVLRCVQEELQKVHDTPSADAAALELQRLLPLWVMTRQTRLFLKQGEGSLSPAERWALQLLESTMAQLMQTRRELVTKRWYASTRLQAIDEWLR